MTYETLATPVNEGPAAPFFPAPYSVLYPLDNGMLCTEEAMDFLQEVLVGLIIPFEELERRPMTGDEPYVVSVGNYVITREHYARLKRGQ